MFSPCLIYQTPLLLRREAKYYRRVYTSAATDVQSRAAYETEQKRIADGRDALPDVETMLSLDDIQVSSCSVIPGSDLANTSGPR